MLFFSAIKVFCAACTVPLLFKHTYVAIIGPYHFLALSQKFLKSVGMNDCIPNLINIKFFLPNQYDFKEKSSTSDTV